MLCAHTFSLCCGWVLHREAKCDDVLRYRIPLLKAKLSDVILHAFQNGTEAVRSTKPHAIGQCASWSSSWLTLTKRVRLDRTDSLRSILDNEQDHATGVHQIFISATHVLTSSTALPVMASQINAQTPPLKVDVVYKAPWNIWMTKLRINIGIMRQRLQWANLFCLLTRVKTTLWPYNTLTTVRLIITTERMYRKHKFSFKLSDTIIF